MEDTSLSLHSWFWLIVPMALVFVLSIINYFRNREVASSGNGQSRDDPNRNNAAGSDTATPPEGSRNPAHPEQGGRS